MGVGNHEVWGDPKIEGVLDAVPYLKKLGVTPENLIYKFDLHGVRFIYLWSGKYDYRSPSLWDADRPKYAEQMKQLQQWLDEAKTAGIRKAFITFHYPTFARSGLGAIPSPDNPHKVIAAYAKDMSCRSNYFQVQPSTRKTQSNQIRNYPYWEFWCLAARRLFSRRQTGRTHCGRAPKRLDRAEGN